MASFIAFNANADDVLYNNLLDASGYSDPVSSYGPLADSFSTGASVENLTDVQLLLTSLGDQPTGSFTVSLYSDNAATPGSLLADLATYNDSVLSSSSAIVDTTVSGIVLAANTRNWIELSTTSNSVAEWVYTAAANSTDNELNANINGVSFNNAIPPYQMAVTAAPVPVPSAISLMGLGIAGLAALRRKSA
jgi:hypothetical protein